MAVRTPTKPVEPRKQSRRGNLPKTDSKASEGILTVGERVQIASTVKPKKYAGKRGEIEAIVEGEFGVNGAWFKQSELGCI